MTLASILTLVALSAGMLSCNNNNVCKSCTYTRIMRVSAAFAKTFINLVKKISMVSLQPPEANYFFKAFSP